MPSKPSPHSRFHNSLGALKHSATRDSGRLSTIRRSRVPVQTIAAAIAAAVTRRIKVGTAGIMLRYQSPLRTAQDFHLLGSLYPGRIECGVIRGHATDSLVDKVLMDGRTAADTHDPRAAKLAQLLASPSERIPSLAIGAIPLWICGHSSDSAGLAASLGAGLAISAFLSQFKPKVVVKDVIASYRDAFVPGSAPQTSPRVAVTCYGVCARNERSARDISDRVGEAHRTRAEGACAPKPTFLGTARVCRWQLEDLAGELGVIDLVAQCLGTTFEEKLLGYEALAEQFGIVESAADASPELS